MLALDVTNMLGKSTRLMRVRSVACSVFTHTRQVEIQSAFEKNMVYAQQRKTSTSVHSHMYDSCFVCEFKVNLIFEKVPER